MFDWANAAARRSTGTLDAGMRTLSVQYQPQRSPRLSAARVLTLLAKSVAVDSLVIRFEVRKGNDRGPYVNFLFIGHNRAVAQIWRLVNRRALFHRSLGPKLRRGTIVTCEGSRGWDNYLLLHHFDPMVPLDVLRRV
jgi:hypothetical protein